MKRGRKGGKKEGRKEGREGGGKERTLQDMAVGFSLQTAARQAITTLNRAPRKECLSKICHLWILFTSWERCTCIPIWALVFFPFPVGKHDTRKLVTNFSLEFYHLTMTNFIRLCPSLGKYRSSLPSTSRSSRGLFLSSFFSIKNLHALLFFTVPSTCSPHLNHFDLMTGR